MTDDLTALRELAEEATPGPWEALGRSIEQMYWNAEFPENPVSCEVECSSYCYGGTGRGVGRSEDSQFIAAANPTTILALLDRLERAEAAIERAKAEAEKVSREQLVMPPEALILADATLAALDTGKEAEE